MLHAVLLVIILLLIIIIAIMQNKNVQYKMGNNEFKKVFIKNYFWENALIN